MSEEFEAAFSGEDEAAPEIVVETPPEPERLGTAVPITHPESAAEPEPTPEPAPQRPVIPEGYVPLATVLDTRDKLKAAEERVRQFEAQQQAPTLPDPYEDPDGYNRFVAAQTQQAVFSAKLDLSEDMARTQHGDELVNTVQQWALERGASDPSFGPTLAQQRNPYGWAVQQYQREQALEELKDPSEFAAYRAWRAAQANPAAPAPITPAAPAVAPPRAAPALPPKSIAAAPAIGKSAIPDDDAFEAAFR